MKNSLNKNSWFYFKEINSKPFLILPAVIIMFCIFLSATVFTGCLSTVSGKQNPGEETTEKQLSDNENGTGKNSDSGGDNNQESNNTKSQNSQKGSSQGDSGGNTQGEEKDSSGEMAEDTQLTEQEEKMPVVKPPAVKLEILSGPEFAQDNSICFYRIKANAEGEPFPHIQFNRDDSQGAWGNNISQINLSKGQSFTLTCSVNNSEGTAQSDIEVDWKEPLENPEESQSNKSQSSSETGYENPANYYIDVNLKLQRVTVLYKSNEIRSMPCSGGLPATPTPLGTFKTNQKIYWAYVPRFAQGAYYWIRFYGSYLFHSVPHDENRNILTEELAKIGSPASHGCIRLNLEDAKWMYEFLPLGIEVNIHN